MCWTIGATLELFCASAEVCDLRRFVLIESGRPLSHFLLQLTNLISFLLLAVLNHIPPDDAHTDTKEHLVNGFKAYCCHIDSEDSHPVHDDDSYIAFKTIMAGEMIYQLRRLEREKEHQEKGASTARVRYRFTWNQSKSKNELHASGLAVGDLICERDQALLVIVLVNYLTEVQFKVENQDLKYATSGSFHGGIRKVRTTGGSKTWNSNAEAFYDRLLEKLKTFRKKSQDEPMLFSATATAFMKAKAKRDTENENAFSLEDDASAEQAKLEGNTDSRANDVLERGSRCVGAARSPNIGLPNDDCKPCDDAIAANADVIDINQKSIIDAKHRIKALLLDEDVLVRRQACGLVDAIASRGSDEIQYLIDTHAVSKLIKYVRNESFLRHAASSALCRVCHLGTIKQVSNLVLHNGLVTALCSLLSESDETIVERALGALLTVQDTIEKRRKRKNSAFRFSVAASDIALIHALLGHRNQNIQALAADLRDFR